MRGCITKKGSGYSIIVDLGRDSEGKRKQKWFNGYKTKKEAEKALTTVLHQLQNNTYIEPSKLTVADYLTNWLETYVDVNLSPTTIAGYRVNIIKHVIPKLGNIQLQKLQSYHIQELYNEKLLKGRIDNTGGLSAKSVVYIHRVLRKALQQAVKMQLLQRNVADFIELPKVKRFNPTILNDTQIQNMLNAIRETSYYLPVLLAIFAGLRRGEVLGLRWCDIDLEKKTIAIFQNVIPTSSGVIITTPKTEKSNRTILLSESIIVEILKHKEGQEDIKKELAEIYQNHDLINCRMDGTPLNPSTFSSDFADILKKHGLPHVRFHDLRHINATLMLKNKIPAKVASERLGHSSIGITLDLYSHVLSEMQQEAVDKLDDVIFNLL